MTLAAPTRSDAMVPRASRSRRPGWRNPRLLLGIVLVAASVLLGARLLAAADDSVGVWAVIRDLPAGATLEADEVERRQVRFPDGETADRYLAARDELPSGATLNRPVTAGELLPRSAFAERPGRELVEVPVTVLSDDLPATVRQGSLVDVWVAPKLASAGARVKAVAVLTDVVVVAVPRRADGFAPQTTRQVIVGVPASSAGDLGVALGGMSDGRIVITRKD